jgi:hypothetical protein
MELVRGLATERGLAQPPIAEAEPFSGKAPEQRDLAGSVR